MPNSPTLMNAGRPLGQLRPASCSRWTMPLQRQERHLRHPSGHGPGAPVGRRHRLQLLPAPSQERHRALDYGGGVGPGLVHDACSTLRPTWSSRAAPGAAPTWASCGWIIPTSWSSSPVRTTPPRSRTSISRSRSPTRSWRRSRRTDVRPAFIPRAGRSPASCDAREVWEMIIHGAWKTGEPGVFFIDKANYYNPVPHLGAYEATNPCGEQPLLPYDVCNLGSINLGAVRQRTGEIDWDRSAPGDPPLDPFPRERHRRQPVPAARRSTIWPSGSGGSGLA